MGNCARRFAALHESGCGTKRRIACGATLGRYRRQSGHERTIRTCPDAPLLTDAVEKGF